MKLAIIRHLDTKGVTKAIPEWARRLENTMGDIVRGVVKNWYRDTSAPEIITCGFIVKEDSQTYTLCHALKYQEQGISQVFEVEKSSIKMMSEFDIGLSADIQITGPIDGTQQTVEVAAPDVVVEEVTNKDVVLDIVAETTTPTEAVSVDIVEETNEVEETQQVVNEVQQAVEVVADETTPSIVEEEPIKTAKRGRKPNVVKPTQGEKKPRIMKSSPTTVANGDTNNRSHTVGSAQARAASGPDMDEFLKDAEMLKWEDVIEKYAPRWCAESLNIHLNGLDKKGYFDMNLMCRTLPPILEDKDLLNKYTALETGDLKGAPFKIEKLRKQVQYMTKTEIKAKYKLTVKELNGHLRTLAKHGIHINFNDEFIKLNKLRKSIDLKDFASKTVYLDTIGLATHYGTTVDVIKDLKKELKASVSFKHHIGSGIDLDYYLYKVGVNPYYMFKLQREGYTLEQIGKKVGEVLGIKPLQPSTVSNIMRAVIAKGIIKHESISINA